MGSHPVLSQRAEMEMRIFSEVRSSQKAAFIPSVDQPICHPPLPPMIL